MQVEIKSIRLPQHLMRQVVNEVGLETLAKSIRRLGIIMPLIIRKSGKEYELVAGMRRMYAAEMCGLKKVPVIVKNIDPQDAEAIKIAENHEREDVNPIDEGEYFADVMQTNDWTQKDLAREVGVSEAYISQRMSTAIWTDRAKENVRNGNLKFSVARELEKITDEVEKVRLIKIAVESGVTPAVAGQWRREVNAEIERNEAQGEMKMEARPQHLPQKVYVTCQVCDGPEEVQNIKFVRMCGECERIVRSGVK